MRAMRMRGRPSLVGLVLVVALGASACTGDDGDEASQAAEELPVEVEGEVLDRRDDVDGEDAEEPDAEASDADAQDPAPEDDADADEDDADESDAGTAGTDEASGRTGASRDADPAPSRPAPSRQAPSRPSTDPAPSRAPAPTPAPAPAPAPTPVATPAPRTLAAGPAESTGPELSSDGVAWTETSSTSVDVDADPPPLTVAMRSGQDAEQRQVRCQAALEAPADRGLAARGTLTVSLRIVTADGTVQVVPRQRIELDVVVAAGQRRSLEVSPARTVDVAEVRHVSCVAELVD